MDQQQQIIDTLLYNRGMVVGLQQILHETLKSTVAPREVRKIIKQVKELTVTMEDTAIYLFEDQGSVLPEAYREGRDAVVKDFLVFFTDADRFRK